MRRIPRPSAILRQVALIAHIFINSALTFCESGALLFHVRLPGKWMAKGWPAEIIESAKRARGDGESGKGKRKNVWIRAESDIKYIRIFSRDRCRHGRSEAWISFWWVLPFRLLLHFSPLQKPTVQSQPLNINVNALGFCGFFTSALCPSCRPVPRPLGHTFTNAFEALLREKGCGVASLRVLHRSLEELRYLSRTFLSQWPSQAAHK